MNLDPRVIQQEITNLLLLHPELAEDDLLRVDMIEAETDAFEFLSRIVRRIGARQALVSGLVSYAEELAARRGRFERSIDVLRSFIFKIMTTADIRKAELPEATLSIRNGTPKVILTNEAALPEDCVKIIRNPDKTKIKELLSAGQTVPGAELSNCPPSLTIRTR